MESETSLQTNWDDEKIPWVRAEIEKEKLSIFTRRSNLKGFLHCIGFLLLTALPGIWAYWSFSQHYWIQLFFALYIHGIFYSFYSASLHELSHNTVFKSKFLNSFFTIFFGLLYWSFNPYMYRLSHKRHHWYTLYKDRDGEVPEPPRLNLSVSIIVRMFWDVLHLKELFIALYRFFTLQPTSSIWRGRQFKLDAWERFVLIHASNKERSRVKGFALFSLFVHVLFFIACIYSGYWFLIILVTLAPFYGARFMNLISIVHQHTACEGNIPDFRRNCGDVKLDAFTSFLYWHMEYHIEHHMFPAIPCYNLKKFSNYIANQMPEKEWAIPRLLKLHRRSLALAEET